MNTTEYIIAMLEEIEASMNNPETLSIPNPGMVSLMKNMSERRIWLDLAVDETVLEYVRYILRWNLEDAGIPPMERKPIWVYLFNYGGSADYMWMLTDVISISETPVYTVNMGQCCSAAALIFMSGHKRYMLPMSSVLIHEGSNEISGDAVKVLDQAKSYESMVKRMHRYIIDHTRIPSATLTRKKNNDWELNAETCLKYGVCDRIIESISEIF